MSLLANSNAIETGGYQISRSVRLRSSASAYFNRTFVNGSRTTATLSLWCKRGSLGVSRYLIQARVSDSANDTDKLVLRFGSDDKLYLSSQVTNFRVSNAVFRDPSAWYHIVLTVDTSNGTASNRFRLYVNNVEQTYSSSSNPSSGLNTALNVSTSTGYIGSEQGVASYFDGYLTEINFIDGQALTPSSFGQTDTITGSWVAKKYTGTYGTNGFYLNFSDNSAATATTIGKDYSGNGNNWTPNNISVTAGTTYDSMLDVPAGNGYADGGNGRGNYCVINPLSKPANVTLSNANLTAAMSTTAGHRSVASTFYVNTNSWFWEITPTTVGSGSAGIGIANTSFTIGNEGGTNTYFYYADGTKNLNNTSTSYGASYTSNDVIGVAFDATNGTLTFYKNGSSQGQITGIPTGVTYVPFMCSNTSVSASTFVANFGQRPFSYAVPSGYSALNTTNLPTPTIGATSTTQAGKYMNAVLYTGTGSSNAQTGVGFQPDLVWIKSRSGATDHGWYDAVRGVQKQLESNTTTAETTETTGLTAFGSDGFTVGALAQLNTSSATYVAWNWKANGTGSTNTAGTITSTVSANTTSGFSVVTWTGNGSASATVGHGLGVAPSMVIAKERTGTDYWHVWHTTLPNQQLYLNVTNAAVSITSGAPGPTDGGLENMTTSTFGFKTSSGGNVNSVNENGILNVAYCFAAISGYSAFGSYTGNGSADGPFVYCGFRPRWVMVKEATTSSRDWIILDTSRNTYNVADLQLLPNTSEAENTTFFSSTAYLDILSNGFKIRSASGRNNESTAIYIYAAFAENPLKFSNAR